MDEKVVDQLLDELVASLEDAETQSAAIMLFLKGEGIAAEQKLSPYLEQAGKASDVRWRAARARMGALLHSAMKTSEAPARKTDGGGEAKETDQARAERSTSSDDKAAAGEKQESDPPQNQKAGASKASGEGKAAAPSDTRTANSSAANSEPSPESQASSDAKKPPDKMDSRN